MKYLTVIYGRSSTRRECKWFDPIRRCRSMESFFYHRKADLLSRLGVRGRKILDGINQQPLKLLRGSERQKINFLSAFFRDSATFSAPLRRTETKWIEIE